MEYVTARLIAGVISEIEQGTLSRLTEHGLELASSKDYVRQTQQRLLLAPILAGLRSSYPLRTALEERLFTLLNHLRERADDAQGYGPANLLALLREQRGHLCGLDLSHLVLRGAYLQDVEMQDTTLSGAMLRETVFTESFDPPWSVATNSHGTSWAMGSRRGDDAVIRLWDVSTGKPLQTLSSQSSPIYALAWSPDGCLLAGGCFDGSIHLWEMQGGQAAQPGASRILTGHSGPVWSLAFAPDRSTLASGSFDRTVRLWDVESLEVRETLAGHTAPVNTVAWSPDGSLLASGSRDQTLWLWDVERAS